MSAWLLWLLIVVIPGLDHSFVVFIALAAVVCVVWGLAWLITTMDADTTYPPEESKKRFEARNRVLYRKSWLMAPASVVLFVLLSALAPNREEIAYIVGGYFVTNIEDVEKLPPNLVKSANKFLEDYNMSEAKE